jgi:pyruvate-formate lyase-activating enzyme
MPVVFGGTHPTTMPEDVLASGAADYVVRGEGEQALVELMEAVDRNQDVDAIANLGFLNCRRPVLNPVRPLIDDIDALPPADRAIFDFQAVVDANMGEAPFMAGRGCPYTCTYCCNNFLQRIYAGKGKFVRFQSPQRAVDELVRMTTEYRCDSIYFQDDTFTLDIGWLRDFAELYGRRVGLPYRAQARVDLVTEEMVDTLASSGCRHINFGLEAGDERIRREVMRRRISDEEIVSAFELARSRGIKLWSYNIIGTPGEGEEEIRKTIELNRRLEPDHVQVSLFNPYPGTELYQRCVAEESIDRGIADDGLPLSFFVELPTITRTTLTDQRLRELYDEFVQLGLLMSARRSPAGYFDLLDHLESAEVDSAGPDHVNLQLMHLDNQERLCLFEHPPSRVTWSAPVAGPSRLVFGIALNPKVWDKNLDGVRFRVEVEGEETFCRELAPARDPAHRGWVDCAVNVAANGGESREIAFITEAVGMADFGWALWSRPHLTQASERAADAAPAP